MLTKEQFNTLLIPIIYHHFDLGVQSLPSMRSQLYNIQTSTIAEEKGTGMGGMSPDAWNQYQNSGNKGTLDFDQLYTQSYVHKEYPVTLVIKKNLIINDQYGKIAGLVRRAGMSAEAKMEIDAFSLFNNAFSTSYNLSDGKPLCSTTHPKSPNAASGSYVNKGTTALSKQAVADTRIAMMRFKDDKGNEIGLMPNELWVPPELEDTALEIARSLFDPSSGNNAINPQAGRWTVKPSLRLTDTTNWFMADSAWRQQVVNWYVREAMQVMLVQETTTEVVYELKLHYSYGADDWRWVYGHEVAGA